MKSPRMFSRYLCFVLPVLFSAATACAYEWTGAKSSDFADPANWKGGPPVSGAENLQPQNFLVVNGQASPLRYTATQGVTAFGSAESRSGQFIVGKLNSSGYLEVSGGELSIYSYWSPIIAQLGAETVGTLHVSGGILRISSTRASPGPERFFRIGNTRVGEAGASGRLLISGGQVIIATEGGVESGHPGEPFTAGGLNVGRAGGNGLIHITGGLLRVTGPNGTSFVPDNGPASGVLVFGAGDGVFEQTQSARLTFGDNPKSDSYVSFTPGSGGALSLAGATRKTFDDYISQGRIRVDAALAEPSAFTYTQEGNQGVLRLAGARPAKK